MAHPYVELAKKSIESYVKKGELLEIPDPLPADMTEKAGVFVSLHENGGLRGCIGTFAPTKKNIAEEIIANAVSSAVHDPRFPEVEEEEIDKLEISVDILTPFEKVSDISALDPKKFGIIVEAGNRKGLLLPDIEGVDTVEQQISICRRKGGISDNESVNIYKFKVRRYH